MSAEAHPPVQVTDDQDNPLRGGTMDEVQINGLWHRAARVMVKDAEGNVLLQKVPANPYYDGGKWNVSASGHVDEGESYLDAAHREGSEELGTDLNKEDFVEIDYYPSEQQINDRIFRRFNTTYEVTVDREQLHLNPPTDEVEEVRWWSQQDLLELLTKHPDDVTDGLARYCHKVAAVPLPAEENDMRQ